MISLSPYGLTGPYKDWKAYDINICALGGITAASGYPEREPLSPAVSVTLQRRDPGKRSLP